MHQDILDYNKKQEEDRQLICEKLAVIISSSLPEATNKLWHGAPVWFLDDNPTVGYDVLKDSVRILFWSGQSFDEPALQNEGNFKAAEIRYTNANQIDAGVLARCLEKSKTVQWDYKDIVKNKGVLNRI